MALGGGRQACSKIVHAERCTGIVANERARCRTAHKRSLRAKLGVVFSVRLPNLIPASVVLCSTHSSECDASCCKLLGNLSCKEQTWANR
eukprot:549486-Amphidinium_carterae.1